MLPILRRELGQYHNQVQAASSQLVFPTALGCPLGSSNIRIRMLARAVEQANADLESREQQPLPTDLTPHSLRRTFASLLFALGEPPTYVMSQMGHTTPALTLAIYAREMNRRDGERQRLKTLVAGGPPRVTSVAHSSTASSLATRITPHHGKTLEIRFTEQLTELDTALR